MLYLFRQVAILFDCLLIMNNNKSMCRMRGQLYSASGVFFLVNVRYVTFTHVGSHCSVLRDSIIAAVQYESTALRPKEDMSTAKTCDLLCVTVQ